MPLVLKLTKHNLILQLKYLTISIHLTTEPSLKDIGLLINTMMLKMGQSSYIFVGINKKIFFKDDLI